MYHDRAAAGLVLVWTAGSRCRVTFRSVGFEIDGLGVHDRGKMGVDLLILLYAARQQIGRQDVAWTAASASAPAAQSLGATALLPSTAYPFELASGR
jgi:hypothetical protein